MNFLQCPYSIGVIGCFHALLLYSELMEVNVSEFGRKNPKQCKEAHDQCPLTYSGLGAILYTVQNNH